jgi:hypothetical protein
MAVSSSAKLKTVPDKGVAGLLEELVSQMGKDFLRDDDVTVSRLADAKGVSKDAARRFLQKKVEAGELVKVPVYTGKGDAIAYRKPPV